MARPKKFEGDKLHSAVYLANALYHEGGRKVSEIARQLNCSWNTAEKLIIYSHEKWQERNAIVGELPLHFEECHHGKLETCLA